MIEQYILKMFLDKSVFVKYYRYLDIAFIKNNYKDLYKVFKTLEDYYNKYETDEVTTAELEAHYLSSYPVLKEGDKKLLSSLFQTLESLEPKESVLDYLKEHKNRCIAGELALVSFDVSEGRKPREELDAVYQKFDFVDDTHENIYVTDDLEELYEQLCHERGHRWRLGFLNQSLGSLRRGDFGFVFARPETGKTTFLASEVTNFASKTTGNILWCNNEEGGAKVKLRCYQAALGLTAQELFADLPGNKQKYKDLIGDRIKIYDDAGMSTHDIEARCKELEPTLIVLDQIDKIKGYKDDRYDLQMKFLYQWARELAKKYGATIGICQAGGTGEGKKWLTMNDVDSSHTAKQGEADWILGIGKSNDEGMQFVRFLNISKNKLTGDDDTLTELRHGKGQVLIKPEIARYEDI